MNNDIRDLLYFVSISDQKHAKAKAIDICEKELTKEKNESNKRICRNVIKNINERPKWMELSSKAMGLLLYEDLNMSFDDNLYYFSDEEIALEQRIVRMADACQKLNSAGVRYRNATLLLGPSGCGKSVFARHIAKALDRNFYMVDLSSILTAEMGGSSKNLRAVFDAIMDTGPNGFLFLDELDAFSQNRGTTERDSPGKELGRISVTLMQLMDGLPPETVLMAATNHEEAIDPAVLRRFSIKHEVKLFSKEQKVTMVQKYLSSIKEKAVGIFDMSWKEDAINKFVAENSSVSNGELIAHVQQAIADMVIRDDAILIL